MHKISSHYDALTDAAVKWPQWRFETAELQSFWSDGGLQTPEIEFRPEQKLVHVNRGTASDTLVAVAVAHLDLGHDRRAGWLTQQDMDDAWGLAKLRLGEVTPETFGARS